MNHSNTETLELGTEDTWIGYLRTRACFELRVELHASRIAIVVLPLTVLRRFDCVLVDT